MSPTHHTQPQPKYLSDWANSPVNDNNNDNDDDDAEADNDNDNDNDNEIIIIVIVLIIIITKLNNNKYGLLTKCEVKMAGYWLSSFFARSINSQKKGQSQYPAILTKQTWSIKDLLYGFWWNFACGIPPVVPSGQDGPRARWLHLAGSGSQSQHAIWFILPARGASHIIILVTK